MFLFCFLAYRDPTWIKAVSCMTTFIQINNCNPRIHDNQYHLYSFSNTVLLLTNASMTLKGGSIHRACC